MGIIWFVNRNIFRLLPKVLPKVCTFRSVCRNTCLAFALVANDTLLERVCRVTVTIRNIVGVNQRPEFVKLVAFAGAQLDAVAARGVARAPFAPIAKCEIFTCWNCTLSHVRRRTFAMKANDAVGAIASSGFENVCAACCRTVSPRLPFRP